MCPNKYQNTHLEATLYLVPCILAHHEREHLFVKLRRHLALVAAAVHEHVVFTVVAVKVAVKKDVSLRFQPGEREFVEDSSEWLVLITNGKMKKKQ